MWCQPGLAGVYWSKGWWRWRWQLDYWSYKSCKAPVRASPPTNQHPVFLQAGCPSCHPTNSVKALKGKKHHHTVMWYNNNCTLHLFSPTEPGCGVACSHSEGSVQLLLFLAASCPGYISLIPGYTTMSDSDSRQYWRQTVDQRPGGHRQRWKTKRRPGDAPLLYNYWGNMLLGNYLGAGPWNMKFCLFCLTLYQILLSVFVLC